jgi:hypothetical protein
MRNFAFDITRIFSGPGGVGLDRELILKQERLPRAGDDLSCRSAAGGKVVATARRVMRGRGSK